MDEAINYATTAFEDVVKDADIVLDLRDAARPDQCRGDRLVPQDPGNRELREAMLDVNEDDYGLGAQRLELMGHVEERSHRSGGEEGIASATKDAGLRPGDRLIVTGPIGDHGIDLMAKRHNLALDGDLRSDVAALNGLIRAALAAAPNAVTAMKDPTRGGVSSWVNGMAEKSGVGVMIHEPAVPITIKGRSPASLSARI